MLLYENRSFTALRVYVIVYSNELLICKTDRKNQMALQSVCLAFIIKKHISKERKMLFPIYRWKTKAKKMKQAHKMSQETGYKARNRTNVSQV